MIISVASCSYANQGKQCFKQVFKILLYRVRFVSHLETFCFSPRNTLFHTGKHFVSHRETTRETVVSCIFGSFICIKRPDIVCICVILYAISALSENLTVPVVMRILKIGHFADLSVSSITAQNYSIGLFLQRRVFRLYLCIRNKKQNEVSDVISQIN